MDESYLFVGLACGGLREVSIKRGEETINSDGPCLEDVEIGERELWVVHTTCGLGLWCCLYAVAERIRFSGLPVLASSSVCGRAFGR